MFSKVFCRDYILLQIGANFLIFFSKSRTFLTYAHLVHALCIILRKLKYTVLEFPQKAVVEAEGCPITLFARDVTHELDLEE